MNFEFMLDTNICIYLMRHRAQLVAERFEDARGRVCMSSITLGELEFGIAKSQRAVFNRIELDRLSALVPSVPFGDLAARHYGEVRAALERSGTPAGSNDTLIGAHARSAGLVLVTNNRREFDRMPGLRVENWV